jgi:hypothetical protein
MRRRGEHGQLTVLIIGFTMLILLLTVVVTDLSKAYLVRRDLDGTADGAVLAAANGLAGFARSGRNARIDPDQARRLAADYLDDVAASNRFGGLECSVDVEGTTLTVRLAATAELPFRPPGFAGSVAVTARAAAVVPVR